MIRYKTKEDINKLKKAGSLLGELLDKLEGLVKPGVSTLDLEKYAQEFMKKSGARPLFKGHQGYPAVTCISVNEEVVHGIPSPNKILKSGDVVGIDSGLWLDNVCVDAARTFPVGAVSDKANKLLEVTQEALRRGIEQAVPGNHVGDIGHAIQSYVEAQGMSVVRGLVGHGVGFDLWEEPQVPNFGEAGQGLELKEGLVIAIEPMVTLGGWQIATLSDGWTIVTQDGSLSAQFEHTIAITKKGPLILTKNEAN